MSRTDGEWVATIPADAMTGRSLQYYIEARDGRGKILSSVGNGLGEQGERPPAAFLGLGHRLGHIAAGYRADLVAFEPEEIRLVATWVAGEVTAAAAHGGLA